MICKSGHMVSYPLLLLSFFPDTNVWICEQGWYLSMPLGAAASELAFLKGCMGLPNLETIIIASLIHPAMWMWECTCECVKLASVPEYDVTIYYSVRNSAINNPKPVPSNLHKNS